jgi:thiol-disulfide isomerase/thioredoxin
MTIRTILLRAFAAVVLCIGWPPAMSAAELNMNSPLIRDLTAVADRISNKLMTTRPNTTNFQENFKEIDALISRYKESPRAERVQPLLLKLDLYLKFLNDKSNALEVVRQLKRDFPETQINGNTDDFINVLERTVATENIRNSLVPGAIFPPFSESDIHGKPLSLGDYKGKVVLIDFWATWCMPCVIGLPELTRLYEKYNASGFDIVGISVDDDLAKLKRFVSDRELPWRQYCEGSRQPRLASQYGVEPLPTTYLLDREGRIIGVNLHGPALENAVAKALDQTAAPKETPGKSPSS